MVRDAEVKFTRELSDTMTVQSVGTDGIHIHGETWTDAIALTISRVLPGWIAKAITELDIADFDQLLEEQPELVILGTGSKLVFAPRELIFAFARRGIGLDVMDTQAAARTFNVLSTEGRRVAAVFYPLA